jgi:hypothetical protein
MIQHNTEWLIAASLTVFFGVVMTIVLIGFTHIPLNS